MKIQHWYFKKRHPEDVPKPKPVEKATPEVAKVTPETAKRPIKKQAMSSISQKTGKESSLGLRKPHTHVKADSEQAILDAYWSKTSTGDRLRNRIMQRMEHVKKMKGQQQEPTVIKRAKTPNYTGAANRKKNMSKLIIMVQEAKVAAATKIPIADSVTCKNHMNLNKPEIARANARSISPNKDDGKSPFAESAKTPVEESQPNMTYISARPSIITNSKSPANEEFTLQNFIDQEITPKEKRPSNERESVTYSALKDQLRKITIELEQEKRGGQGEDALNSHRKPRRTREDRNKRNMKMISDISAVIDYKNSLNPMLTSTGITELNATTITSTTDGPRALTEANAMPEAKENSESGKRPLLHSGKKKPIAKPSQPLKENVNKPSMTKQKQKPPVDPSKKESDAKKHMARRYLGELYTKIMFKLKDIERGKKAVAPQKRPIRILEKSATCRQDLAKENSTKLKSSRGNLSKRGGATAVQQENVVEGPTVIT